MVPSSSFAPLEAVSVDVAVAISAERDQILNSVVTQPAPRAHVLDLETVGAAAGLAAPVGTSNTSLWSLR